MTFNEKYLVTRAMVSMMYEEVETNNNINDLASIVGNCVIRLTGYVSKKKYSEDIRKISPMML